jgi:hypothetical protein
MVRSPTEVVCLASSFIAYWAELQPDEDNKKLEDGGVHSGRRPYSSIRARRKQGISGWCFFTEDFGKKLLFSLGSVVVGRVFYC